MYNDENRLFYLFSAYVRRHVQGARLNFLQKAYRWRNEIPMGEQEPCYQISGAIEDVVYQNEFVFEEERLASAFQQLPERRKKLLEYLFIEDLAPKDVAGRLGGAVDYVYHLKRYTLRTLRKALQEDQNEF